MTNLTNAAGDRQDFKSAATLWSNRSGYAPDVKPNGLATGGAITPAASGSNNVIDITALTCYIAGVETSVGATTDETVNRPTVSDYQKHSVTVTALGAIAVGDGRADADVVLACVAVEQCLETGQQRHERGDAFLLAQGLQALSQAGGQSE